MSRAGWNAKYYKRLGKGVGTFRRPWACMIYKYNFGSGNARERKKKVVKNIVGRGSFCGE